MAENNIRKLRQENGLTPKELARILNIKEEKLLSLEESSEDIDPTIVQDLSEVFNVSQDYILGDELDLDEYLYTQNEVDILLIQLSKKFMPLLFIGLASSLYILYTDKSFKKSLIGIFIQLLGVFFFSLIYYQIDKSDFVIKYKNQFFLRSFILILPLPLIYLINWTSNYFSFISKDLFLTFTLIYIILIILAFLLYKKANKKV